MHERPRDESARHAGVGPVAADDRVLELDVLRGLALFGVLLVNITAFAQPPFMATEAQLLSLPSAGLDGAVSEVIRWLIAGKAYTLFAFLFGLGFYVQLERMTGRGADFERIYLRRLAILLLFGLVHVVFVWAWEILHLYAIAGFILFAMRRASDRFLLWGGLALAITALPLYKVLIENPGLSGWHGLPSAYDEAAIQARQAVSEAGDYPGTIGAMLQFNLADWLLSGLILGWLAWSLGRFMIGAWVGRRGWFQNAGAHLPGFRRVLRIALPAGLILCGIGQLLDLHAGGHVLPMEPWKTIGKQLHNAVTPVLTLGYVCATVVALHTALGRRLLAPFAHAGRMALTNYVGQSLVIGLVLYGIGPGLALAGRIGTAELLLIVVVAYAAQVVASAWWLARFRFGPLEWLWRALTYGELPRLRIRASAAA